MLKIRATAGGIPLILCFLRSRLGRILIVTSLGVSTAIACGWSLITDRSVRFNGFRTGRGFYRLPPLPISVDPVTLKEQSVNEEINDSDYDETKFDEEQAAFARPDQVWAEAMAAAESGDPSELQKQLRNYLDLTKDQDRHDPTQDRRNVAIDLLDVIAELGHGTEKSAVIEYVKTRVALYNHSPDSDAEPPTDAASHGLDDNWAYLHAATLYQAHKNDDALAAFQENVKRFPKSEKTEAGMYMIGRIKLESSYSFQHAGCGIEGMTGSIGYRKPIRPDDIEDPLKCRDENWRAAMDQFKLILRKFPTGQYSLDARGWIAFLYDRGGYRAEALAEYYRLLGQTRDRAWRLEAKKSLQLIGHEYDDETLNKLESLIADEPEPALAYAYHRIYNQAVDLTYEELDLWCCAGDNRWSEQQKEAERIKTEQDAGRHELERITKFSTAMVKRYGTSRVSGDFILRVAEAQLELRNLGEARNLAQKALRLGINGDSRAQALWVEGSANHVLKAYTAARSLFSQLIVEFPDNKLTEGARRLLAMTAEDQNDLETALEQYLALKYDYDVAYFIDVLMPTDRLARFVENHKDSGEFNYLLYSLGVRYMRDERWNEARAALKGVSTDSGLDPTWSNDEPSFPKKPEWSYGQNTSDTHTIKDTWVMRDLQTIDALERLEGVVASAPDDESKAEAMYQLASYQYDADPLLFYNPAAWDGIRSNLLAELSISKELRLPGEGQNLFEYSKSHDTLARSIPIYMAIVDQYPNTIAAKDALFTAVVAQERLSNMNDYWRSIYANGFVVGPRLVTDSDIRRMFPKFRWPLSRLEWEASTRTVAGHSAYPPSPKPVRRLSRGERAKRKLKAWYSAYSPPVFEALHDARARLSQTSNAFADQIANYLYLVYAGLIGFIIWANRKELYNGPLTKGFELSKVAIRYLQARLEGSFRWRFQNSQQLLDLGVLVKPDRVVEKTAEPP